MQRKSKGSMLYKMKGTPMYRNFGIGSPLTKPTDPPEKLTGTVTSSSLPTDQSTMGSTQEGDQNNEGKVTDTNRYYVGDQGKVFTARMLNLKKREPESVLVDGKLTKTKAWRDWQRAFNKAQADAIADWKKDNEGHMTSINVPE